MDKDTLLFTARSLQNQGMGMQEAFRLAADAVDGAATSVEEEVRVWLAQEDDLLRKFRALEVEVAEREERRRQEEERLRLQKVELSRIMRPFVEDAYKKGYAAGRREALASPKEEEHGTEA